MTKIVSHNVKAKKKKKEKTFGKLIIFLKALQIPLELFEENSLREININQHNKNEVWIKFVETYSIKFQGRYDEFHI